MEGMRDFNHGYLYRLCEVCAAMMSTAPGIFLQIALRKGSFAISFISGSVREMCGTTDQALLEDASFLWMNVEAEDRAGLFEAVLSKRRDVRVVEFRFLHPERGVVWFEGRFSTNSLSDDDSRHVQGVITDISERKDLERRLQALEEDFVSLFSQMRQPVSVHDIVQDGNGRVVDFVFVDGNQALESLLNYRIEELRGKSIRFVNPTVPDEMVESLGRVAITGEPLAQDYFSQRTKKFFNVVSYSPRRGRFVSIHTDLTDWRKAEEASNETNSMLKSLNSFAVAQANCLELSEFTKLVADQLYDYLKPVATAFCLYDPASCVIRLEALSADPDKISRVVSKVGAGFLHSELPIDQEEYAGLLEEPFWQCATLAEASAGIVRPEISAAIQEAADIASFIVITLAADEVLYGSLLIALSPEATMPSEVFLGQFAYLTSIALRRLKAEEQMRYLSQHDQLTGLYNRHYFDYCWEQESVESNLPLSVIIIDLNGLKELNDKHGHARGDEVILSVANVIRGVCRPEDLAFRWGGDEFLVLLPRTDQCVGERIARTIADKCQQGSEGPIALTVAMGVSCKLEQSKDVRIVIREAEDAMYKNKLANASSARSGVLTTLLKLLEEKSFETQLHSVRMQEAALAIATAIKLTAQEVERLKLAILLHDIGKINVHEDLLLRKGSLNEEEWSQIKRHPEVGSRIALSTPDFAHVADEIMAHHERWDGTGYPRGLKGESIPKLARIVAIVDAYEVMSYGRPYKKAMSKEAIVSEYQRCAGTHFDPNLVKVFLQHLGVARPSRRNLGRRVADEP